MRQSSFRGSSSSQMPLRGADRSDFTTPRRAPRDRLRQALGEFIELVVRNFSFRFCLIIVNRACADAPVCPRRPWAQLSEFAGIAISIAAYRLPVSHFNALAIGIRATEADGAEAIVVANAAAALAVACTGLTGPEARLRVCPALIRQRKAGPRHAGEAEAECL